MQACKQIAIVIPWFGRDLVGGAEQQSFQIALRMVQRGHAVTVLTTCCASFYDNWSMNHLPPGESQDQGITIKRFPVDQRNSELYDKLNAHLLSLPSKSISPGVNALTSKDLEVFTNDSINSKALLAHLDSHRDDFDAVIFIPYMFGVILQGLPIVSEKAFLQPCLHDESYAYLPQVEKLFRIARGLFFNSEGEAQLATRLYGPGILGRSFTVGEGIEPIPIEGSQRLPDQVQPQRYVLYLGRRDPTKNLHLLINSFGLFKKRFPESTLKLVLAGPGETSFAKPDRGIEDLGAVSELLKAALLRNMLALFQPSTNESYSRVMMEAWSCGRPVVVNGDCLATSLSVADCKGGWIATTETEWADVFAKLDSISPDEATEVGKRGEAYARKHGDWENVIDRYEQALLPKSSLIRPRRNLDTIHQLLPDLSFADAISNHALAIRDRLRSLGYNSDIFVRNLEARVNEEAKVYTEGCLDDAAGLIYHHSIGTELTAPAIKHRGPRLLIYHNITPADFFRPYRPGFAWLLEQGRNDLKRLAKFFPLSVGDSAFNAAELAANVFVDSGILPIMVDPAKWNVSSDTELKTRLEDGEFNILFVGRIAPNKMQVELVKAFGAFQSLVPNSRLTLVGDGRDFDPYYRSVLETIDKYDLTAHVVMAGQVSEAALKTYYQTAHLYWSMSEHEGFCVPIVEAMWFDVPVLAYKAAAVPETLANAGVLFDSKEDLAKLAELARDLVLDGDVRKQVIANQRRRRESFLPKEVWSKLDQLLDQLEADAGSLLRSGRLTA